MINNDKLIKTIVDDSDAFSTGLASDEATMIYHIDLEQLEAIAEAYFIAKCAGLEPAAHRYKGSKDSPWVYKEEFNNGDCFASDKLFTLPQSYEASDIKAETLNIDLDSQG